MACFEGAVILMPSEYDSTIPDFFLSPSAMPIRPSNRRNVSQNADLPDSFRLACNRRCLFDLDQGFSKLTDVIHEKRKLPGIEFEIPISKQG